MAKKGWRSEIRLVGDLNSAEEPAPVARGTGSPFVIDVIGDFRGRAAASEGDAVPLATRRFVEIDRDNFDEILARFDVRWYGTLGRQPGGQEQGIPVALRFRELDDFHPDRIVRRIDALRPLVEARSGLSDPTRFETAAAEIGKWAEPRGTPAPPAERPAPRRDISPSALLDEILGEESGLAQPTTRPAARGDLERFLHDIVGPHLVKLDLRRQTELIGAVDGVLSEQVRAVLHDRTFQHVEATWRSMHWLIRRLETGPQLKVRILPVTQAELRRDLQSSDGLEDTGIARLFLDAASVPGAQPPALVIGNYAFDGSTEDIALLERLGAIGRRLGAPFVAAATPSLLGCDGFTDIPSPTALRQRFADASYRPWQELRASPDARWLALALPRVLCRLPYGAATNPTEGFAFEEQTVPGQHDTLLWANPAFAVAAVVADAFAIAGWSLDLSRPTHRLEGLPLYLYEEEGTARTTPCAEVLLPDRVVEALQEEGLLPLVSHAGGDIVALPCLQSLGRPRRPLHCGSQER